MCGNQDEIGGGITIKGRPVTPKGEPIHGDFLKPLKTRHRRTLLPADKGKIGKRRAMQLPTANDHP